MSLNIFAQLQGHEPELSAHDDFASKKQQHTRVSYAGVHTLGHACEHRPTYNADIELNIAPIGTNSFAFTFWDPVPGASYQHVAQFL